VNWPEKSRKIELIRTYLSPNKNILSKSNKCQKEMKEGDNVFKEAIHFLKNLNPLKHLQWEDNLILVLKSIS